VDSRAASLNRKIREAQLEQVFYILVVGEKEQTAGTVNVRTRDGKVHGTISTEEFLEKVLEELRERG
jgi:threonyl-tRNA synthetase